jgi:hypothetical protein
MHLLPHSSLTVQRIPSIFPLGIPTAIFIQPHLPPSRILPLNNQFDNDSRPSVPFDILREAGQLDSFVLETLTEFAYLFFDLEGVRFALLFGG